MCGENTNILLVDCLIPGSPPRVRGKPLLSIVYNTPIRITPACAGKTKTFAFVEAFPEDHPRVCGENSSFASFPPVFLGSPPRVRGKLGLDSHSINDARITPACAGKTDVQKKLEVGE